MPPVGVRRKIGGSQKSLAMPGGGATARGDADEDVEEDGPNGGIVDGAVVDICNGAANRFAY